MMWCILNEFLPVECIMLLIFSFCWSIKCFPAEIVPNFKKTILKTKSECMVYPTTLLPVCCQLRNHHQASPYLRWLWQPPRQYVSLFSRCWKKPKWDNFLFLFMNSFKTSHLHILWEFSNFVTNHSLHILCSDHSCLLSSSMSQNTLFWRKQTQDSDLSMVFNYCDVCLLPICKSTALTSRPLYPHFLPFWGV